MAGTNYADMLLGSSPQPEPVASAGHDYASELLGGSKAKAPKQEDSRPENSTIGGFLDSATQAITLGLGDELTALEYATFSGSDDKTFWQEYDEALSHERAQQNRFADEHPVIDAASRVGGAVATAPTLAARVPIAAATTLAGRAAQAAGGGLAYGAAQGFGEGEGGFSGRVRSAGAGGAVGAIAGPLVGLPAQAIVGKASQLYSKGVAALFGKAKFFDPKTGQLTDAGRQVLSSRGLDPDAVTARLGQEMEGLAKSAVSQSDDATARAAQAAEFGIPTTSGQRTGDLPQIAFEEAARAGARGQGAYSRLRDFDEMQGAAVSAARTSITPGGRSVGATDAAGAVIEGVKRNANSARMAAQDVYRKLDESGAMFPGADARALSETIGNSLRRQSVLIDTGTPNARQALKFLGDRFSQAEKGAVKFSHLEGARQRLRVYADAAERGAIGGDKLAMREVIDAYDAFLETSIDRALTQGAAETLTDAKTARKLWSSYKRYYGARQGADNFIRKIADEDLSPDQVAGWMMGASRFVGGNQTAGVAKRLGNVLGRDSDEFQSVRSAVWNRMTAAPEGRTQPGPQQVSEAIFEAIRGKGKALTQELYTQQERATMLRFANALKVITPPKKATNPSGSGYENARAVQQVWQGLGAVLGFAQGGAGGAVAGKMVTQGAGDFANAVKAKAAVKGITGSPSPMTFAVGTGGGLSEPVASAASP